MFSDWLSAAWQLGREKLLTVRGCGGNYVFLRFEARADILGGKEDSKVWQKILEIS